MGLGDTREKNNQTNNNSKIINVGFIGNPNCGKTTLFNAYTGANLKVANWPGVTVEKKEAKNLLQRAGISSDRSSRHLQSLILYDGRNRIQRLYFK